MLHMCIFWYKRHPTVCWCYILEKAICILADDNIYALASRHLYKMWWPSKIDDSVLPLGPFSIKLITHQKWTLGLSNLQAKTTYQCAFLIDTLVPHCHFQNKMLLEKFCVALHSFDKWWDQTWWDKPCDRKAALADTIKQGCRWRIRHKIVGRKQFPYLSEILQRVVNKFGFPFHRSVAARIVLSTFCWRMVSNIKVSLNAVFESGYYGVSFHIFLVVLHPNIHFRIISTKLFTQMESSGSSPKGHDRW